MNMSNRFKRRKTVGQAMVEFALALPILLLVILGLIEAGRLIDSGLVVPWCWSSRAAILPGQGGPTGDEP